MIIIGLGYGIGGLGHHTHYWTENNDVKYSLVTIGGVLTAVAHSIQNMAGITYILKEKKQVAVIVTGLLVIVGIIISGIWGFFAAGLYGIISALFMFIIYVCMARQSKRNKLAMSMKVLSMLLFLSSFLTFLLLAPLCGNAGYKNDCWEHCPLPIQFNHNTLFHTIVALSLPLLAYGELKEPDAMATFFTGEGSRVIERNDVGEGAPESQSNDDKDASEKTEKVRQEDDIADTFV